MVDHIHMLALSQIKAGGNPRKFFSPEKHDELVSSLRLHGLLQPILLRPGAEPETFAIIAGERRYRAALEAFGPDGEVPVIVREMADQQALEAAIAENDVRDGKSDYNPIVQAFAAHRRAAAVGKGETDPAICTKCGFDGLGEFTNGVCSRCVTPQPEPLKAQLAAANLVKDEAVRVIKQMHDDLLMRAARDDDGTPVVAVGAGVWSGLCSFLATRKLEEPGNVQD